MGHNWIVVGMATLFHHGHVFGRVSFEGCFAMIGAEAIHFVVVVGGISPGGFCLHFTDGVNGIGKSSRSNGSWGGHTVLFRGF